MSSVTFSTAIGGDGSTVTDDDNASTGLRNGGWRTRFIPCFTQQVAIAATLTNRVLTLSDTSASSVTIGTGSKSFTTAKFYTFAVGQFVVVASSASPSNYMYGQVTAYNSSTGALTVNVTVTAGSGTISAWAISCSVASGAHVLKTGDTMTGSLTATSFSGAGTGLTGTASGLSIGGNAATATTATTATSATSATSATTAGSCTGNAATVTNGVYTTGSYSNPAWVTALAGSKITGAVATATDVTNAIGNGQTWQTVSRAFATNYTNSTGKPIMVAVRGNFIQIYVNGAFAQGLAMTYGYGNLSFIVPNGAYYTIVDDGGGTFSTVTELR